jgi:hypothetical protein
MPLQKALSGCSAHCVRPTDSNSCGVRPSGCCRNCSRPKPPRSVIMEAYALGVSTCSVDDLVKAPRVGHRDLQERDFPHLCRPQRGGLP